MMCQFFRGTPKLKDERTPKLLEKKYIGCNIKDKAKNNIKINKIRIPIE